MDPKDEARLAALEKQVERLTQVLDGTRRHIGLPSIIDEQLLAINLRGQRGPRGNAA
jgi:hypothetical protein